MADGVDTQEAPVSAGAEGPTDRPEYPVGTVFIVGKSRCKFVGWSERSPEYAILEESLLENGTRKFHLHGDALQSCKLAKEKA